MTVDLGDLKFEMWPIGKLRAAEYNPRGMTDAERINIRNSMQRFGVVVPAVVNTHPDRVGVVVGGNQRVKIARDDLEYTKYPCALVSLDLKAEQELNIRLNKNQAHWEDALLRQMDEGTLLDAGFSADEIDAIFDEPPDPGAGTGWEEPPEPPDEARSKLGELYTLGHERHRLYIQDSTVPENVAALMDGQRAAMVFTDPPYGVQFQGKGGDAIEGDITYTAIPLFFETLRHVLAEKSWCYVCGGSNNSSLYLRMFERYFRMTPRIIVWDKMALNMRHNGYHSSYELIFHAYSPGAGALWFGPRDGEGATDVWHVPRPSVKEREHLTEKPVELPARAIGNSCQKGGVVYDPFGGSGSTLVAAEQSGRRCYMMEMDPRYADVILDRWSELTGEDPVRSDGVAWSDV